MRIVIASAEGPFCQEIRTLLESVEGITVIEQQAGPEVVDLIQGLQPDLILLDLDTGTGDGPDLVSMISRRYPDIKIVVLSAPGYEDRVLSALRNGARGHLVKGADDRDQLVAALRAVSRGDSILSPTIAGVILDEMSYRYQLFRSAQATAGRGT